MIAGDATAAGATGAGAPGVEAMGEWPWQGLAGWAEMIPDYCGEGDCGSGGSSALVAMTLTGLAVG